MTTLQAKEIAMKIKTPLCNISRFAKRENAISFNSHAVKPCYVVMRVEDEYWSVTMAEASRLEKLGYEFA